MYFNKNISGQIYIFCLQNVMHPNSNATGVLNFQPVAHGAILSGVWGFLWVLKYGRGAVAINTTMLSEPQALHVPPSPIRLAYFLSSCFWIGAEPCHLSPAWSQVGAGPCLPGGLGWGQAMPSFPCGTGLGLGHAPFPTWDQVNLLSPMGPHWAWLAPQTSPHSRIVPVTPIPGVGSGPLARSSPQMDWALPPGQKGWTPLVY